LALATGEIDNNMFGVTKAHLSAGTSLLWSGLFVFPLLFAFYSPHQDADAPLMHQFNIPSYKDALEKAYLAKTYKPTEKRRSVDTVHIVLCFDTGAYNLGMKAMINSIIMNTLEPQRLYFHFIVDKQHHYHAAYFVSELKLLWPQLRFDYRVWKFWETVLSSGFPANSRFSNSLNIARIYLQILFPRLQKIISLDTDELVLGDIVKLWDDVSLEDHSIAAPWANDATSLFHYVVPDNMIIRAMNLNLSVPVFGAGLFIANLTRWRTRNVHVSTLVVK